MGREAESKLPLQEEEGKESELRPEAKDQPASADGGGSGHGLSLKETQQSLQYESLDPWKDLVICFNQVDTY